jgi:two-component system chemotaxis sensor kinase CheA
VSEIRERLLAAFQVEHREHIQAVRAMLDGLERDQYDPAALDLVEGYRRIHSLKGAARAVGLRPVEVLAHKLESLVSRCQKGVLTLDRDVSATIRQALDEIEDCTAGFARGRKLPDSLDSLGLIARLIGEASAPADDDLPTMPASPGTNEHEADVTTRPAQLRPGAASEPVGGTTVDETVRVNTAKLDGVLRHTAEILAELPHQDVIGREIQHLRSLLGRLARDVVARNGTAPPAGAPESLADGAPKDRTGLAALVSEMNACARRAGQAQREAAWRLRKAGLNLHGGVRALRIVPAESVFGGVRQMARDLAREESKQVEVDAIGLDILVDRSVLQALKDPVMHLLRNAIHHGVEPPEVRTRRGKPAAGRITFSVAVDRNRLLLRLEEDGRGLDRDRILAEAQKLGILQADEAPSEDPRWLTRILVRPNFTTAPTVTEVSGRGIGLSVVDKAVRQLQGAFELRPRASGGTTARISVPLAVSGNRLLLTRCRSQTYGIPVQWLERLYRIPKEEILTVKGEPAIRAEDSVVPLISLAQLLGHADAAVNDNGGLIPIALLRMDDTRLAIGVDEVGSMQDGIIQDLDASLSQIDLISGGAILNDGSIAFVLNPPALIGRAAEGRRHWVIDSAGAGAAALPPLVLVVDDSITTRTLERSILEARGYRVLLSVDGLDALDQLRRQRVDLVIVDIEMPRMDGFELLRAMKQDEALSDTPVILVTSRDSPQDRHKGLTLGAQAYIIKQHFDQRDLLNAIEQIL